MAAPVLDVGKVLGGNARAGGELLLEEPELYAALDDAQKRMLDRRVLLSQADPLTFGRTEKPE